MLRAARLASQSSRRSFATVVDAAGGVKVATVDNGQPISTVTVLLKAGSRYEQKPGLAHVLSNFAFKSTGKRSALGTVREAELRGGLLSSTLSREHLALTAEFLRGDESFFVDVLADYIAGAKFTRHELTEYVLPAVLAESAAVSHSNSTRALELAHAFAFRSGLGHSLYADEHSVGSITAEDVKAFHAQSLSSLAVLGTGISSDALTSLFEKGFKKAGISPSTADASASKSSYYGGSTRVTAGHGPQTVFIGFGTSGTASLPALYALNAHISPAPSVKWTTGTSTLSASIPAGVHASTVILPYSDATLFGVLLEGYDAKAVSAASKAAVDAFKSTASKVSAEDATKAVAKAKFTIAGGVEKREGFVSLLGPKVLSGEQAGLDSTVKAVEAVDAAAISKLAGDLLKSNPTIVAIGDIHTLPYQDELGL
ncbi:LuxS/MPP-like metallohydrolase [Stereum hirsutum FP-91666 SS1]|uniref:LuxS/MPP-like metallohydrolase n=1 Tax=Stereum hirsutum (strain FP-91666) TaxID=721885 RepID=UPI000440DC1B|nr:LuxS/MPP-like metallohydrolase [Stereum hirsutum FP-91666 SS1]EIM87614.1 LuxS/MPP-like metallohydrolase [Stereum hirsutum FP-91666 SS1]